MCVFKRSVCFVINGGRFSDYEKWSVLEPSVVQNKLNTWPKDYTSIVVTKNDTEKEIIYVSSFGYGLFQFIDREPSLSKASPSTRQ